MTQFDLLILILLGGSALVGFVRGAVREVAALLALGLAVAATVLGLPLTGPIARQVVQPDWLGTVAALVVTFLVVFISLRLIASVLARRAQSTQMIGFLDRVLGLALGLARGLIVLGVLFLMFTAATPPDLRPTWITAARTWPLANAMGQLLQAATPRGAELVRRLKPSFDRAVDEGSGDRSVKEEYEARNTGPGESSR